MARRHRDWLSQAERALQLARLAQEAAIYEAACFQSQQAAEMAAKAWLESQGRVTRGHSVRELLLEAGTIPDEVLDAARKLDSYYIPTRYPNAFASGAPRDYYDREDGQEAIEFAERVIGFVEAQIGPL